MTVFVMKRTVELGHTNNAYRSSMKDHYRYAEHHLSRFSSTVVVVVDPSVQAKVQIPTHLEMDE
jgi:hypothetical protein